MTALHLTVDEQRIAHLVFDVPGEKVNTFSAAVMVELNELLARLSTRQDLRALVVTSAKPDIFIAGADIKELQTITTPAEAQSKARVGQEVFQRLASLPFPTVAVIDGACLGGGMEFALACTYRVVSDADKTSLGLPEVSLGILPGWGGTQRLPRLVGVRQALDMILAGRPVKGAKALKIGLADACFARAFLADEVPGFVQQILTPEGRGRVLARRHRPTWIERAPLRALLWSGARKELMRKTKGMMPAPLKALEVIRRTTGMPLRQGLQVEAEGFAELAPTSESKCLIDLFFAGESLKKLGPKGADKPRPVQHAGVLGAGVMGGGIAWLFAHHGVAVRLKDIAWDAVAKGFATADDYNRQLVKMRKLTPAEAAQRLLRISGTTDFTGLRQADVVVEAVVEDLGIKRKVFAELEGHIRDDCVVCTNTSSLSVAAMAEAMRRPERFVGMHFFNPVNRMPLVEVVPGPKSDPRAVDAIVALSRRLGKTPVVVKDCPGFLVNRILLPYMNEAAWMLQEGADLRTIDRVIAAYGMPMGPFTLTDEVGIDVGWKVAHILAESYGERMKVADVLTHVKQELKLLGRKGGSGFYLYGDKRSAPRINPDIDHAVAAVRGELGLPQRTLEAEEIRDRCLLTMVNESARCIEEQVIAEPAWLDLAMVMGTGFPPQRGGPLHHADALGLRTVVERLERLRERHGMRFAPCQLLVDMARDGRRFFAGGATRPVSPDTAHGRHIA